ncbi:extracellular solute-binding protein [Cohnella hashimotonis]|uniref:Extracellular solute-binding protein n=1 Tax=Cohnella hashimotonis TaxID=2826895 RepID=A0ABT6TL89_9BACL|nr:extracellular solute-binding protein [Cohnella hashimotonis]MDI4647080.1 extracellular solute-binding protein [Cohnella hashimotonis]
MYPGVSFDNKTTHYIEEKTNTKLEITAIPGADFENKLQIMLASGDKPDIIQIGTDALEMKFTKSGLLLPLNASFDKTPNLQKFGADGIWDAMKHSDGNVYAIPIRGSAIDNIPIYRKDWLDKLGLKVPTTIDEYYAVADAFSNKDPDGNGKKDTYALSGWTANGGFDLSTSDQVFGAYGTLPNSWLLQDGKLVWGSIVPGALDALKFLNKMYKGKMIDPEFVTDNSARFKDKVLKGVIGAPVYRYFLMDSSNLNNYYEPLKQNNPNAEFVEGGILKGPGDSVGFRMLTRRGWLKTAVLNSSPNVDAALRVLDFLASDEGNKYMNYGEEGVDYKVEGDLLTKTITDDQMKQEGIGQLRLAFNALYDQTSPRYRELFDYAHKIGYKDPADGLVVENNTKQVELDQYTGQQYVKMIMSDGPIDNMFADYVKEWKKRGGDALTQAFNDAYQEKNKK